MERCGAEVRGGLSRGGPLDSRDGGGFPGGREALDLLGGGAGDELGRTGERTWTNRNRSTCVARRAGASLGRIAVEGGQVLPTVDAPGQRRCGRTDGRSWRGDLSRLWPRRDDARNFKFYVEHADNELRLEPLGGRPASSCGVRSQTTGTDSSGSTRKDSGKTGTTAFKKPEGVFRVLCLGDSTTFSLEPAPVCDLSSVARGMGSTTSPLKGPRYEVINAGTTGYSSCQGLQLYKYKGARFGGHRDLLLRRERHRHPSPLQRQGDHGARCFPSLSAICPTGCC